MAEANFKRDRFISNNCLIQLSPRQEAPEGQFDRAGFQNVDPLQGHPHQQAFNYLSTTYGQVLEVLDNERRNNELYKTSWQMAKDIFTANPMKYASQEVRHIPDECHIAIIAYTSTPIYADFNAQCRNLKNNEDSWDTFNYKSFYWLLAHSLNAICNKPNLRHKSYRGVDLHFDLDRERPIFLNQFASCSTDSGIADSFRGLDGTIIEFPTNVTAAIGISNYSQFEEKEILIFPWNTFMVKKIDRRGPVHRIILTETTQEEFRTEAERYIEANQNTFQR